MIPIPANLLGTIEVTMVLPYQDWLSLGEKLNEGITKRVPHDCGDGDVMIIEHNSEGFRAYCHRCHESGWKPHGRQSLNKLLNRLKGTADELQSKKYMALPSDMVRGYSTMPISGRMWLARGGITSSLADQYNIGYSDYYGRVILPCYSDSGELIYYQARAVHEGQTPKYLNPKANGGGVAFRSSNEKGILAETVVITEDILSAIKVGQAQGYTGYAILGTSPSTEQLNELATYKDRITWFDGDTAGISAAIQCRSAFSLRGLTFRDIRTKVDPKRLAKRQIQELLDG